MLEFNPYFRPSARELIRSAYFDDVRIEAYEMHTPGKLTLEIDEDEAFNMEENDFKFTLDELQAKLRDKIGAYTR